jgi:hypothetical protein
LTPNGPPLVRSPIRRSCTDGLAVFDDDRKSDAVDTGCTSSFPRKLDFLELFDDALARGEAIRRDLLVSAMRQAVSGSCTAT